MITPKEREAFYDREVAPTLLELARKCEDAGLSFLAMVEWAPGQAGKTMSVQAESGLGLKMTRWAMESRDDADALIMQMMRYGKEHGHESVCLTLLGGHGQ